MRDLTLDPNTLLGKLQRRTPIRSLFSPTNPLSVLATKAHITDPRISAPNNPASSLSESTERIAQAAQVLHIVWGYDVN